MDAVLSDLCVRGTLGLSPMKTNTKTNSNININMNAKTNTNAHIKTNTDTNTNTNIYLNIDTGTIRECIDAFAPNTPNVFVKVFPQLGLPKGVLT